MKATIVPVTKDNLDLVAETTRKYGFPRSSRWVKRLLFDPNVPEGRESAERGALIMSDKNECVGMYCWAPCSIYVKQERKSAYIGALLGVDKKYSPWILDVIDRNIAEVNGRFSYGNDCVSIAASKFWTRLGTVWGPTEGAATDIWYMGVCAFAYAVMRRVLRRVKLSADFIYWLCLPLRVLCTSFLSITSCISRFVGLEGKWRFNEEKGFSDESFMPFWERFLAANNGVVSSREPATLRWKFDESIQAGAVTLISAKQNGLIDGYVLLRRNPVVGTSVVDYSICDICAVGNDAKCLNALLKAALRYCSRRMAVRVTYVGAPCNKRAWMVKWLHRQASLACNPFSYSCKDQTIINAVQENNGWFFGPYDGERCMGCGRYVDL